jgi:hypothetical protein
MEFDRKAEDTKTAVVDTEVGSETQSTGVGSSIYLDPETEASARRKFDKYLIPVSLIFIILSALDRNNVRRSLDVERITSPLTVD